MTEEIVFREGRAYVYADLERGSHLGTGQERSSCDRQRWPEDSDGGLVKSMEESLAKIKTTMSEAAVKREKEDGRSALFGL